MRPRIYRSACTTNIEIEIPVFEHGDERFIRASFQAYNDAADLGRLGVALAALL
jgi:selenocysteine lyase/cysteine desulfurase